MCAQSIVRKHLSIFCSSQACSPSAPVLGASEVAPDSSAFGLCKARSNLANDLSKTRSLMALRRSAARPLQQPTAMASLSLSCFFIACLIARPQQIGTFSSDVLGSASLRSSRIGSDSLGSPSSARTPSAWLLRIDLPGSSPLRLGPPNRSPTPSARSPFGSVPRLGPHRLGPPARPPSARSPRLGPHRLGPPARPTRLRLLASASSARHPRGPEFGIVRLPAVCPLCDCCCACYCPTTVHAVMHAVMHAVIHVSVHASVHSAVHAIMRASVPAVVHAAANAIM